MSHDVHLVDVSMQVEQDASHSIRINNYTLTQLRAIIKIP